MASSKTVKCFLSFRNANTCGGFKGNQDLVLLSECQNDLTAHLQQCHLSKEGINSERELIMMRAGFLYRTEQQFQTMFVCPRHQANLGKYWGNQSRRSACQYPEHRGKKTKGGKNDRVVSVKLAREVQQIYAVIIPVGSGKTYANFSSVTNSATHCLFSLIVLFPNIRNDAKLMLKL